MNQQRHSIWHYLGAGGGDTPTDRKNNKRLALWSFGWGFSIVAASMLLTSVELPAAVAWSVVLAPNLIAFMALKSYLTFLRMTDELQRRVQIEGLAIGFGTGYAIAIGYLVAEAAGAPPLGLHFLILFMTAGWLIGNFTAMKRYQ